MLLVALLPLFSRFAHCSGVHAGLVKEVKPQYTPEARAAKIEGEVQMSASSRDGTVGDVKITQSLDSKLGLDDEAVKAAKQWLFEPGRKTESRSP